MTERTSRKDFLLMLPAALAALVVHKETEEPTVICEEITINQSDHPLTVSHFHVQGRRDRPGVTVKSKWKGKLKEHPRAAEIEEKMGEQYGGPAITLGGG